MRANEKKQDGLIEFQALAAELVRQRDAKRDFIGDTRLMAMTPDAQQFAIKTNGDYEQFKVARTMHEQLAEKLGIPYKYYQRMQESVPELLAANVNTWLQKEPKKRMVRTLDGNARAFLSNAYRPLDNYELLSAAMVTFDKYAQRGLQIRDCGLTPYRMYVKATVSFRRQEVVPGDVVEAGIVLSNSEIGAGSVRIEPIIFRLVCSNGMITKSTIKQFHVGKRIGEHSAEIEEMFTAETLTARDRAFWLQVRDVVSRTFEDSTWFDGEVEKLREAKFDRIEKTNKEAVEVTQKSFRLTDKEADGVLERLIISGDFSKYGLANAVTNVAQNVEVYDRRIELERTGYEIIEMPKRKFAELYA